MPETGDKVRIEWPKEILEILRGAGPVWSATIGGMLLATGWLLRSPAMEGAGIGVLALAVLLRASRRPSKLIRKDAFLLPTDYFVGREKDADDLTDLIREERLIWVTGESGCGKSSLLRYGVLPRLKENGQFVPLYINTWGKHWEAGPVAQIATALRDRVEALGGKLEGAGTASELAERLEAVRRVLGRTPVLILDQFDDYLAQNVDRFRRSGKAAVIKAKELKEQNAFWRELSGLVERDAVRCVLVVRLEQSWGQAAIAFTDIREACIYRLKPEYLDETLRQFGSGAIQNPDGGWDALRERLQKDLTSSGGILPVQMRIVLRQLSTLKALTVRAYDRRGGHLGLAGDYVKEVVERTASATPVAPDTVHVLLRHFVNPKDASKTRDFAEDQLREAFAGRVERQALDRLLKELRREDILLDRADETGARLWRLDHDYLARVVEELHARANAVQRRLDETAERLRQPGFLSKVAAVVESFDPVTLVRVAWGMRRGQVRIGGNWAPVAISAAFTCGILALLIGYGVFVLRFFSGQRSAQAIADGYYFEWLATKGAVTAREGLLWNDLATEPLLTRQIAARRLFGGLGTRLLFSPLRMRMAAAALGGLSPSAPRQFALTVEGQTEMHFLARVFLASQFGQDAEPIFREMLVTEHPIILEHLDLVGDITKFVGRERFKQVCAERNPMTLPCQYAQFLSERDASDPVPAGVRFPCLRRPEREGCAAVHNFDKLWATRPGGAVKSNEKTIDSILQTLLKTNDASEPWYAILAAAMGDDFAPSKYTPALLNAARRELSEAAAKALSVFSRRMAPREATEIGGLMLGLTLRTGRCFYFAGFVRPEDIYTALAALNTPACAQEHEGIQEAIAGATTHVPAGRVDRWTFAREWVARNASRYGYDPERYNELRPFPYFLMGGTRKWIRRLYVPGKD